MGTIILITLVVGEIVAFAKIRKQSKKIAELESKK